MDVPKIGGSAFLGKRVGASVGHPVRLSAPLGSHVDFSDVRKAGRCLSHSTPHKPSPIWHATEWTSSRWRPTSQLEIDLWQWIDSPTVRAYQTRDSSLGHASINARLQYAPIEHNVHSARPVLEADLCSARFTDSSPKARPARSGRSARAAKTRKAKRPDPEMISLPKKWFKLVLWLLLLTFGACDDASVGGVS